ncbi:hypothetical protein MUP59_02195 [Candidatus Bathyarchaeota archaeon]|nr:hypothetical protein [Candidatus Bathyarchaeota archaeon]
MDGTCWNMPIMKIASFLEKPSNIDEISTASMIPACYSIHVLIVVSDVVE